MILDTDYIKDRKQIKTKLELAKPNGQIIGVIINAHNKSMNLLFNGIGELNFTIPYQVENGNTVVDIKSDYEALEHDLSNFVDGGKQANNDIDYVVNPQTTSIKELMYVKVTYLNGQHQWFVIDSISDTVEDSDNMDVVAFTTEYELKRKRVYTEIDLGTTTISESIGTILNDTGWQLGSVDTSLDGVYRNIVIDTGDKYPAIMEIAESFGAILEWDSSQKTVDIDIIENKMENKGLIINEKNMLNGLTRQRTTDEIITRMYVFGEDDLSIESVNPTGNRYIEDFSYFIYPFERDENKNVIEHSFYMSDELAHAMLDLSELSKTILPQIQDKQQSIIIKNQELSTTTIEYYDLESRVSLIKGLLQIAKATNDTVLQAQREAQLVDAEADFENIKYKKETLESEISALQNDIFQLQKQINTTSFTPKLQKELAPFIIEGEFRDDRYIDADELYQDAKTHLTKNNLPRTIIEADLQTVLLDPENNGYRDKIVVGDLATVKYDKLDIRYQEPIVEIEIDLDETNIQLTLSDNNSALDSVDRLVDIIYDTATTTATMEGKSHKWDTIIDVQSEVDKIRNGAIHTVNQRIYAGVNEDITIGSDGLVARNPDFPDEMLILQSGVLALSQDNGATWKTAITPDGIMADTIIGKLLLGNELVISNDAGTFVIDQDGITANADMIRIMSGESSTPENLIDSWNSMLNTMSEFSDDGILNEYEKNQLEKQYNHESNAYSSMILTYQNVMGPETTDNPYSQEFDDFVLAYTNLKEYLTNTIQADGYAILDETNRANTSKIDPSQYNDIVNAFNSAKERFMLQIPMDYSSTQIRETKDEIALEYLKSGEVINQINLSDEGIAIDGSKITIDGNTTFKDDLIMDSGKITSKDGQSVVIDLNAGTIELLKPLVIKGDVVLTSNEVAGDIVDTKKQYGQTTDPSNAPTSWYDEPLPWVDGLYIWEKEIHYYRNGKEVETTPVNITGAQGKQGEKGNDGLPGKDGVGVKSTSITYTSSSNGTTAPTSGWTSAIPTVSPGDYQWTRTIWTYTDNTTETGYSVAHIGKDGNDGTNGVAGKDGTKLLDTVITYAKSTNGTTPPSTGWTSSVPSTNPGDYIWTKTVWTYDDGTDETGYSVGMIGKTGAQGKQGPRGLQGLQGLEGKQGIQGPKGDDGQSTYTHIGYATSNTGANFSHSTFNDATYIGMYVSNESDSSDNPADYEWTLIKGRDGRDGIEGKHGTAGMSSFVHFAYADSADGTVNFSTTDSNREYIGTYTDSTITDYEGGRNYFALNKVRMSPNLEYDSSSGVFYNVGTNLNFSVFRLDSLDVILNQTYVVSFEIKALNDNIQFRNNILYVNGVVPSVTHNRPELVKDKWIRIYSEPFYYDEENSASIHIYFNEMNESNEFELRRFQVEKGNIATDWTPAPEDIIPDSNNPADYTWSKIKGDKGDTGDRGPQGATGERGPRGATGTSVESVTEYYLATSASSGITSSNTGFKTTMQPLTATNKYLWNYEKINFSDGTSQPTIPVIIGVYGDKGQTGSTGATGRSIVSITEHYLATSASSGVTRSTSGWSTSMKPTTETNKYLWNYETINWSSGTTPTYVEPIIIGVHGARGPQGPQGPTGPQGEQGAKGEDATIISPTEPKDKTKLWRKSADSPEFYMYVNGEWKVYDSRLEDIVQSVKDTIEEQPTQWQGDINTNVQNVIGSLTEMQTELNDIHNELTGKANQEEILNSEEIENIVNEVLERYPDLLSLKQHFRFDAVNGLSMSATDASNQALETSFNIKNDGARIYVNGAVVAYFTETETLTSDLNVERTAYLGNHAITRFNGYENNVYDENKNITVFAWAPRKVED